ncbi:MAG TPA: PEP/pyruvate-binding domain-containing protein [Polyangiales bacterium]|nr:PEP/pyruvate-binding domain-containing protein [Polyangiales bacterium]
MVLRPIDALLPRASRSFGTKARNLAALVRAGFPVPAAHAMSSEVALRHYAQVLPAELQPAQLFAARQPAPEAIADARDRVLAAPLPADVVDALGRSFAALRAVSAESLAVRSSSTAEDLSVASAAGLHTSVLNVRSESALLDAVRLCLANAFSPRLLAYLHNLGVDNAGATGVILQALVPADVAGVLFTVNPLSGDPHEIVIDAGFGLGSAFTDGRATPDTYRVDKDTGWVRDRVIGDKRVRLVPAAEGGLREELVPPAQAQQQALDEHLLAELVALGRRVEEHFGDARDVEFAIAGNRIYLLQARAVSGLKPTPARTRARRRKRLSDAGSVVWSNLNVGEALPGVATPLTWSVLSEFSQLGFEQAFSALGCKVPKDAHLVGNFRGRIYLNLSELAAIARQVPGLRPSVVLALGGGSSVELERLERDVQPQRRTGFLLRLPATVARFARSNLGFRRKVEGFESAFEAERARIEAIDLRILSASGLDATLSDVHRMLDDAGTTLLTAYGGLLSALVPLRAALRLLQGDRAARTQQALLSALTDVESAGPGRAILTVAAAFGRDPAAAQRLLDGTPLERAADLPAGEARNATEDMLRRYGHRGVREAELSEPRWREQPRLLFDALRVQLLHVGRDPQVALDRRVAELRAAAEAATLSLPAPLRPALKALLSVVRNYLRLRELLRSHVVRVLGLFRLIALDASRRLAAREPELGPDAAFFLTLSELHGALRGELATVLGLVRLRRAQYARDRSLPDPPGTFVGYPTAVAIAVEPGAYLKGLGASSGEAEGAVRVLRSTDEIASVVPGEILVVPSADVGWAPVFVVAGGLVTDVGGPLSHACVVAREYGLPTVVNVRAATRALQTGERVRIDGDAGIVQRLSFGLAHGPV